MSIYDYNKLNYAKTSFGLVLISGLYRKIGAETSNQIIGNLPEGYRPSMGCEVISCNQQSEIFMIHIKTTGVICFAAATPTIKNITSYINLSACFMAQ